ncbi:hypothetical protein DPMN_075892 [Dreissena polymorpha]|uniref:Uncharacterized protein n=2 Tax=Dreissena polymorpha TaxID=45954 RepID=A0A9D3YJ14_DREPO|nr:hypothetical protein DPMN_075892 [Dreissena polymorpha]
MVVNKSCNQCVRHCHSEPEQIVVTESFVDSLTDSVIQTATAKDVMVKSIARGLIKDGIKGLLGLGISEQTVRNICASYNVLKNIHNVVECMQYLIGIGLDQNGVHEMCQQYPGIVNVPLSEMKAKVDELHGLGFHYESIVKILVQEPKVLERDFNMISSRIEELKKLFKRSDTLSLLEKSPKLLFCESEFIHDRFNYVFREMGVSQRQMMYSNLFQHPMEHIHARHMFLVRAGFFKKVNREKGQIDSNPKLEVILETSDEDFAKMFGGMSLLDYQTFKTLLLQENFILKELENENDDD